MCGEHGIPCSWGRAVSVSDRYIYASQPTLDRILVVSTAQMAVVDVVGTDKVPVELEKVLHLDQLWLLSWREGNDTGIKTVQVIYSFLHKICLILLNSCYRKCNIKIFLFSQVIRDAGQKRKHHTVHPEPIDGQFDMVKELFLPSSFQVSLFYKLRAKVYQTYITSKFLSNNFVI